jgi:hypothetical protein
MLDRVMVFNIVTPIFQFIGENGLVIIVVRGFGRCHWESNVEG